MSLALPEWLTLSMPSVSLHTDLLHAGFIQAIYTVVVLLAFIPISLSFHLAFTWQVG